MQLLGFRLPRYSRLQWVNKQVKDLWEPRLNLIRGFEKHFSILSVQSGLKECSIIRTFDSEIDKFKDDMQNRGLIFLPIEKVFNPDGWIGVISKNLETAYRLIEANSKKDEDLKAELLGVPKCCHEFNVLNMRSGYHDSTFQYAKNGRDTVKKQTDTSVRLRHTASPAASPFLKNIGIKVIPHTPCSPECTESNHQAELLLELAKKEGCEGVDYLIQILDMPMEWNALKGIGYLYTPLFKAEFDTVACYPVHIVQKEGSIYPTEAPRGLTFPYNEVTRKKVLVHDGV